MEQGRILVITGSPGTGKTTTSSIIAKESSMEKSVHMHTVTYFYGHSYRGMGRDGLRGSSI